jgi:hypothetical protein
VAVWLVRDVSLTLGSVHGGHATARVGGKRWKRERRRELSILTVTVVALSPVELQAGAVQVTVLVVGVSTGMLSVPDSGSMLQVKLNGLPRGSRATT